MTKDSLFKDNRLLYDAMVSAMFENYESLYVIDVETSEYRCYHESEQFMGLRLAGNAGDFFATLREDICRSICPEDQEYVYNLLNRDAILAALDEKKYHSFVYRLMVDGRPVYHKIRAIKDTIDGRLCILIGVRDVDATIRLEQAHNKEIASLYQKEKTHLEAILAGSAGYLDANLTRNRLLELSPNTGRDSQKTFAAFSERNKGLSYEDFEKLFCERYVVKGAKEYAKISSREYLTDCFARGEDRAAVLFSFMGDNGCVQSCRKVCYLYKDESSGDILTFNVLYDLTEYQRQETELRRLEEELKMSRIRNFTSQMQPHFLYNALGSIQEILRDDPEYASELIGDFTIHLRSCIRAMSNDRPLPFSQELENVRAYVNIEKMRFGDKLRVKYDIKATDFDIIPLSIQPMVENAIRHGVYERGPAGGTVTVRTRERGDAWVITVEDNGVGFDVDALRKDLNSGKGESTGIQNTAFRLDNIMNGSIDIDSTPGEGTTVTVIVPKGGGKK